MAQYNVLVVDDSPTMRQLIVFALKRLRDVSITEANDGVDGLKKISSAKFDLVLTDINMPVMDGLKLVSLIRGRKIKTGLWLLVQVHILQSLYRQTAS